MTRDDIKNAMTAIYAAKKQGFPSKSVDELIDIAAEKVFESHGWSSAKKIQTITGGVGSYKFEMDNGDFQSYAGVAYKTVETGTLPFSILDAEEFDSRYGDVSQLSNGATFFGKIDWDSDNEKWYLWTERPMSTADTIKVVYYKRYKSFNDLPNCARIPVMTIIDYLLADNEQKWSIINFYNAIVLPQAIDEDQRGHGLPDKWDNTTNMGRSPFYMSDKYGE